VQNIPSSAPPIGTGYELGEVDARRTPTGVVLRTPVITIGTALSIVGTVVSGVAILGPGDPSAWFALLAIVSLLGIILFPSFGYAYAPTAFYLRRLRAAYPDARVLPGGFQDPELVNQLVPDDVPRLPKSRPRLSNYLVIENERLLIFSRSGTSLVPYLELPRSRVRSADIGSTYVGKGMSASAVVMSIAADDGKHVHAKLVVAPSRLGSPTRMLGEIDDDSAAIRNWVEYARSGPQD
jgi:hypothetical protein